MKKIVIPKDIQATEKSVDKKRIEAYFEDGGKAPSIKEQLILKAYEITDATKILYDSEELTLLYSMDETGIFLSCFNKTNTELVIELPLSTMALQDGYLAYCVLTAEKIGVLNNTISLQIPDGGVLLVKLIPENK